MANIGIIKCVVCGTEHPVKAQKSGFAMLNCPWCGFQGYARSEESDRLLRAKMRPIAGAVDEPPAKPAKPADKEKPRTLMGL